MFDRRPVLLLGATGLIGSHAIAAGRARRDLRLFALARREVPLPPDARVEVLVAEPAEWEGALRSIAPAAVICALGTTWRKAGREEPAFRAVDHDLVLTMARAAKAAGVRSFVLISSVGADPGGKTLYLRVKGEVERALEGMGFARIDIVRPGLLLGARSGERRAAERAAMVLSPLINLFLHGQWAKYRSIRAADVAAAALQYAGETAPGRFVHEYPRIRELAAKAGRA